MLARMKRNRQLILDRSRKWRWQLEVTTMMKASIWTAIWLTLLLNGVVRAEDGFFARPRLGLETAYTQFSVKTSVPVHPNDVGTVPVEVELNEGLFNLAPKAGLAIGYDLSGVLDVYVGADARLNLAGVYGGDGYREDPYEVERFTEHVGESYAYVQLQKVPWYSLVPFVGVRFVVGKEDEVKVGLTYSFSRTEYDVESGWDRFGAFQKYASDSLKGDAHRWSLTIGGAQGEWEDRWSVELFYETADLEGGVFDGEHDMYGVSFAVVL